MPNNMKNHEVLLVGAGPMAMAYAKVLDALEIDYMVIGRGLESARIFENTHNKKVLTGGLDSYLSKSRVDKSVQAIVAVDVESLQPTLLSLHRSGVNKILIEKPAALSIDELMLNRQEILTHSDSIFVAYNRRFYSSVLEVEELIKDDGGLQSMQFEFTEWTHKIDPSKKRPDVLANWFFANSTHVVNLAFFLGGKPELMASFSKPGNLKWHEKTNFSGAGITDKGVVFSYLSNWESAGRWSIELLTAKRRLFLKPLEGIGFQLRGTIPVVEHIFDDSLDRNYKPGLYKQVLAFLEGDSRRLVSIAEHIQDSENIYKKILS